MQRMVINPQVDGVVLVTSLDLRPRHFGAPAAFFHGRQNVPVSWSKAAWEGRGGACLQRDGIEQMLPPREFFANFTDVPPAMGGLGDGESLFTNLKGKKAAPGRFLVRRLLAIQQTLVSQELDNAYWLPGLGNPADGKTQTKSNVAPLLHLLESGAYNPGALRPLQSVVTKEVFLAWY